MFDREKVVRAVETCFDSWIDKHRNMGLVLDEVERMKRDALELLKDQPEVVRCKDCKRRLECDYWIENGDDWFCADGERNERPKKGDVDKGHLQGR